MEVDRTRESHLVSTRKAWEDEAMKKLRVKPNIYDGRHYVF